MRGYFGPLLVAVGFPLALTLGLTAFVVWAILCAAALGLWLGRGHKWEQPQDHIG